VVFATVTFTLLKKNGELQSSPVFQVRLFMRVSSDYGFVLMLSSFAGHEMVGIVSHVGAGVSKFKVGDRAAVGCFVSSCKSCDECKSHLIQYCPGQIQTYASSLEGDDVAGGAKHTMGGYSQAIVVDQDYVLSVPSNLDMARTAPLLCAGITTYSPLIHYGLKAGNKIAVLGLGGLGHLGVKFSVAMGAHVTGK
jgi:uncharacterized zinc-type alcohol dehydrogenase-like protein